MIYVVTFFFLVEKFLYWFILVYLFVVLYCYLTFKCNMHTKNYVIDFWAIIIETIRELPQGPVDLYNYLRGDFFNDVARFDSELGGYKAHYLILFSICAIKVISYIEWKYKFKDLKAKYVEWQQGIFSGKEIRLKSPNIKDDFNYDGYFELGCNKNVTDIEIKEFFELSPFVDNTWATERFFNEFLTEVEILQSVENSPYFQDWDTLLDISVIGPKYWYDILPKLSIEELPTFYGWEEQMLVSAYGIDYAKYFSKGEINPYDLRDVYLAYDLPLWILSFLKLELYIKVLDLIRVTEYNQYLKYDQLNIDYIITFNSFI